MEDKLKEFLETDEGKEFFESTFAAYAKEKGFKAPDEVEGLVNKNKELIGKLKKAKESSIQEDSKKLLDFLLENDISDVDDLESVLSKDETVDKGNPEIERQFKRLQKDFEKSQKDLESALTLAKSEKDSRLGFQKKSAITEALKKANVKEDAFDFAYSYFDRKSKFEENDEGAVSIVALDDDGLSPTIDNYISEWSKTDKAKSFITPPDNRGGNIGGPGSSAANKLAYSRKDLQDPELFKQYHERKRKGEQVTISEN